MDKVKHALGLDKSGSGGAQGMGDNRLDGHNTYDAKAGGSGVHTAADVKRDLHMNPNDATTANPAYDPNSSVGARAGLNNAIYDDAPGQGDHHTRSSYNSNAAVGMTNAATVGTGPGYQEHHAHHDKHHGHHTASGAVAGGVVGGPAGAVVGGVAGHEMGERGQHGHHNQHATTTTGTHGHDGQQKEGMMHKIERKMGMDPETRELKKEEKAMHQQHGNTAAGGIGGHPAGTSMPVGTAGQTGNVQTRPVENVQEHPGGHIGKPDAHGNVY